MRSIVSPVNHPAQSGEPSTIFDALPLATEDRTGYQRTSFKHWNSGDIPNDGCNTRNEVLLAEAIDYPAISAGCTLHIGAE